MKWEQKEERIVKRFALLPICIDGEYRWLETVYIKQRLSYDFYDIYWREECFVDKEEWEEWKRNDRQRKAD